MATVPSQITSAATTISQNSVARCMVERRAFLDPAKDEELWVVDHEVHVLSLAWRSCSRGSDVGWDLLQQNGAGVEGLAVKGGADI